MEVKTNSRFGKILASVSILCLILSYVPLASLLKAQEITESETQAETAETSENSEITEENELVTNSNQLEDEEIEEAEQPTQVE